MIWLFSILAIGLILYTFHNVLLNEVHLDRIEMVNSTYYEGVFNLTQLKIDRINHNSYALQTDVEILVDLDEDWEMEAYFYYNRFGNNNYFKTPNQIFRSRVCNVLERYREFIAFRNVTNLPEPKFGQRICPIKVVTKI